MKVCCFFIAFVILNHPAFSQHVFNVKDFGASGEKSELSTQSIQKAIDACHESGGGTVLIPAGSYLSGTIVLKSRVTLYLDQGATLYASQNEEDYNVPFDIHKHGNPKQPVLIYAENEQKISIQGGGTIHGQARRVYEDLGGVDGFIEEETENARKSGVEMKKYNKVPPYVSLIYLVSCRHIDISDVKIIESVDWSLHIQWSEKVNIRNCYIYTDLEAGVNADGIDIDGCKDVTISDCVIETGDDAIVLKSTLTNNRTESCENITVTNCILTSTSAALKIGTETYSDFNNIVFSNCVIKDSNRGFNIVVRDGGTVRNVLVSNITMELNRKAFYYWGNADPIWLVILKRNEASKIGKIENISFDHIIAHGQGSSKLQGYGDQKLKNISFNNVQLFMHPEDALDKRATHALEASKVDKLTVKGLSVYWDEDKSEENWGSAFFAKKVESLTIDGFYGRQGLLDSSVPVLELQQVSKGILRNIEPSAPIQMLIRIRESDASAFKIDHIDSFDQAITKSKIE